MNRKAFTLIELLVVIAIIAILAAILFPVFAQAKLAAKKTADLSNVKQLATATIIYGGDNDDAIIAFPFFDDPDGGPLLPYYSDVLMPYVKSPQMFRSEANSDRVYNPQGGYRWPGARTDAENPTTPGNVIYRVTYTPNHMVSRGDRPVLTAGAASFTAIDVPAEIVLLGPSQTQLSTSSCQNDGQQGTSLYWNVSQVGLGSELFGMRGANFANAGFSGGANFSFTDGHAGYSKVAAGGDLSLGNAGGTYVGFFPRAKTRNLVGPLGAAGCPTDLTVAGY